MHGPVQSAIVPVIGRESGAACGGLSRFLDATGETTARAGTDLYTGAARPESTPVVALGQQFPPKITTSFPQEGVTPGGGNKFRRLTGKFSNYMI
jgi:hypothetical protein